MKISFSIVFTASFALRAKSFTALIAEGAKSMAVTSNPFWANMMASYPLPQPMIHTFPGEIESAMESKMGVAPPKSHPASSSKYMPSQN